MPITLFFKDLYRFHVIKRYLQSLYAIYYQVYGCLRTMRPQDKTDKDDGVNVDVYLY